MGRFDGKTAVVVGGRWGIGRSVGRQLAAEGAAVVVADIQVEGAESVAAEIVDAGGTATPARVDVTSEDSVRAVMQLAVDAYGRLDVLHNNAAATGPETIGRDRGLENLDLEVWDRSMDVNARGMMLGCKHAVGHMRAAGGGTIVNTTSVAGLSGDEVRLAYGCSKAAVIALTRYVAAIHGRDGIRCNAVAPGVTITEFVEAKRSPEEIAEFRRHQLTPMLGGHADDVANVVTFLASSDSDQITGQTIVADGGLLSYVPSMGAFV